MSRLLLSFLRSILKLAKVYPIAKVKEKRSCIARESLSNGRWAQIRLLQQSTSIISALSIFVEGTQGQIKGLRAWLSCRCRDKSPRKKKEKKRRKKRKRDSWCNATRVIMRSFRKEKNLEKSPSSSPFFIILERDGEGDEEISLTRE